MKKTFLPILVLIFSFAIYNTGYVHASTCSANVSWDKTSINKGESATETWTVTGATSATGTCVDGDTINSSHPVSFGPQSYTFNSIQKSITCSAIGTTSDGNTCESGPQTVTVRSPIAGSTPPSAPGGERCFFTEPGLITGSINDLVAQPANYSSGVNADVCSSVQTNDIIKQVAGTQTCAGNLTWKTYSGAAWNAPELKASDGYTATLSGGSFNNASVSLAETKRLAHAELFQNNTYTLNIKKNGVTVPGASCSVKFSANVNPTVSVSFNPTNLTVPSGGTYPINTSKGALTADYKYGPQLPGLSVTYNDRGIFDIFLGQLHKTMYFAVGHWPGAAGKWDLTDPFNPKAPNITFLGNAGMGEQGGPLTHIWPHASVYRGTAVAEGEDGSAQMLDEHGLVPWYGNTIIVGTSPDGYPLLGQETIYDTVTQGMAAISFPSGGNPSFGQQFDYKYDGDINGGAKAVFATSDGSFFGYGAKDTGVYVFDMSNTTGSASKPYIDSSSVIGWAGVQEMHITHIPNRDTQFMIAVSGSGNGNGLNGQPPVFHIGELSNSTGRVNHPKVINFSTPGTPAYAGASTLVYSAGGIQSATIKGVTYIFLIEKRVGAGYSGVNTVAPAKVTIGAYKFDPQAVSVTRVGGITVDAVNPGFYFTGNFQLVSANNDSIYPLIVVNVAKSGGLNSDLNVFNTKDLLVKGGDITPTPEFTIPAGFLPMVGDTVHVGDAMVNPWHFQGFIGQSGSKNYLYIYREVYQYNGFTPYDSMFKGQKSGDYTVINYPGLMSVTGNPSLRIDRIDVTSLISSSTSTPSTPLTCATGALFDTATGKLCGGNTNPTPGSCTAAITFDKASVVSGDPVTETWKVDGADVGQSFTDCGAGEVAISAGPLSKVINPTKTLTCRVYGKIGGKEMCTSPSVTVTISATQAQANALNVAASTTTPTTHDILSTMPINSSTTYNFGTTTLKKGSTGPAVVELQRFLNDNLNLGLVLDGKLGAKTIAVIKTWQSNHGLVADGLVGAKTKGMMKAEGK